jgi:hypothetical protein
MYPSEAAHFLRDINRLSGANAANRRKARTELSQDDRELRRLDALGVSVL